MIVRVVFAIPLHGSFSYRVPETLESRAAPGSRVVASFGRRRETGFIVAVGDDSPEPGLELKEIEDILDQEPVWPAPFLRFVSSVADDFFSPAGEMLMNSLPPVLKSRKKILFRLTEKGAETAGSGSDLRPLEKKVSDLLSGSKKGYTARYMSRRLGKKDVSALLGRMLEKGLVEVVEKVAASGLRPGKLERAGTRQLELSFGDSISPDGLSGIERRIAGGGFAVNYLFGAENSLERAYLRLADRALTAGGRVLVLTPEAERAEELARRFGGRPDRKALFFHGRMSPRGKEEAWRSLVSGPAGIVVGTRSAVFLPLEGLRLIMVDSEDDDAHFQAESPSYDARRAALLRAREEGIPVVFGSSCPTVEAFHELGQAGVVINLDGKRAAGNDVQIFSQPAKTGTLLSPALVEMVNKELGRDRKVVLFFNRRGYASSLSCPACGFVARCPKCGIPLVLHLNRARPRLVCHYCNLSERPPAICPVCGGRLETGRGPGIQALEEELQALFPRQGVARFDADSASSPAMKRKILGAFLRGKTRILIGTRLLAGRVPVENLGLVAVVRPERILEAADYRSDWNAFQTLFFMLKPFRGLPEVKIAVQTSTPAHFSILTAAEDDYDSFYRLETEYRRLMNYPPFINLAEVVIHGRDVRVLGAKSREFSKSVKAVSDGLEVLGPVLVTGRANPGPAGVQFILKAPVRKTITGLLSRSLPSLKAKATVVFSHSLLGSG